MNVKISIGIPTFNQGLYLEKAITSVLDQTVKPYEFIISNNHSTDGITDEILKKYSDKVKIISPPEHLNMIENFCFLEQNMTGDYITFSCSDDFYEKNFIEEFLNNLNDEAVLHRFGVNFIDEAGRTIRSNRISSLNKIQSFPKNFYEQLSGPKGSLGGSVLSKEAVRKVGFFDTKLKLTADWGLFLKLAEIGKFAYIDEIVSNIRVDYRPSLPIERFPIDVADFYYIYGVIQKGIIENNQLNSKRYNNALKLRLFSLETFMKMNDISKFPSYDQFKELVPIPHIKSKFQYLLRCNYQRFYEALIKR